MHNTHDILLLNVTLIARCELFKCAKCCHTYVHAYIQHAHSPPSNLTLLHWTNYSTSTHLLQPFSWTRCYLATRSNLVLDLLPFGLTVIGTNRIAGLAVLKDVFAGQRTPKTALPGFHYFVLFVAFTTI